MLNANGHSAHLIRLRFFDLYVANFEIRLSSEKNYRLCRDHVAAAEVRCEEWVQISDSMAKMASP